MVKPVVYAYTDGACRGNPGPGGWGALLRWQDQEKTISGGEQVTTNNRMELMAAIEVCRALKKPCILHVTTDSQYVKKGITEWIVDWKKNNWKNSQKKPVKNQDLWQLLESLVALHEVHWHWIKGHAGHVENEIADTLAREAIPPEED